MSPRSPQKEPNRDHQPHWMLLLIVGIGSDHSTAATRIAAVPCYAL